MGREPANQTLRSIETLYASGPIGSLTDAQLVDRFLNRAGRDREDAFAALVHRHGPMVLGLCRRSLRDPAYADDAFQAVFLVLARNARSVRRLESLRSWLFGVAVRTVKQSRRRSARIRAREGGTLVDPPAPPAASEDLFELRALLDEELGRLPTRYREPLLLCELEGASRRDAAQRLGLPEGTLSTRLARGRVMLRNRLVRRGVTGAALATLAAEPACAFTPPGPLAGAATRLAFAFSNAPTRPGTVPAAVASLAEGVLSMIASAKLKTALTAVCSVIVAAGLTTGLAWGFIAGRTAEPTDDPKAFVAEVKESKPDEPPPTIEIRGVVVDESGAPVAGAEVRSDPFGMVETQGVTGADGAFAFLGERGPLNRHPLLARTADGRKVGVLGSARFSTQAEAEAPVRIVVKPGREITVRVVDAGKAPVAEAGIDVVGLVAGTEYPRPFALAQAATGADGAARLVVPIDAQVAWIVGRKRGRELDFVEFATYGRTGHQLLAGEASEKLPSSITLTLGAAPRVVRIKALDRADKPVAGLEFYIASILRPDRRGSLSYLSPSHVAVTDADGIAVFDWLPTTPDPLLISPWRTDAARRRVILKEGESEAIFRYDPLEAIRGRVVLPDGSPAEGVQVVARGTGRGLDHGGSQVFTGTDGSYEMKVSPDEGYVVYVEDPKWTAPTRLDVAVHAGKPVDGVDFHLTTGAQIHGTVFDLDGRPVPNARISLHQTGDEVPADLREKDGSSYRTFSRQLYATSDAEGRYAFHVGPGDYFYIVTERSHATPRVSIAVKDETEIIHDYRLSRVPVRREAFTGKIVAASDGKPLAGATVRIIDGEDNREHGFPVRAGADGRFQTERAHHRAYVEAKSFDGSLGAIVEIDADDNNVVVPLLPTASAQGVLLDEEELPVANQRLITWNRQKISVDGEPSSSTNYYSDQDFTTNSEGRFTLTGLIVGQNYTVEAMNGKESRAVGVIRAKAPGPLDAVTLRVAYANPRLPENLVIFRNNSPDVGKVLPEFAATNLNGKPLSLKDFAGKYVLIHFYATWCGAPPQLQDVYDVFGKDDRFTILSLSVDKSIDLPQAYQEEHKRPWPQGFVGVGLHGFKPNAFTLPKTSVFVLVGPDGKIIARDMSGPFLMSVVQQALEEP